MRTIRSLVRRALLLAGALALLPAQAAWPERPIRIIFPFAVGGVGGSLTRIIADGLAERLGQAVVVDPRPGAGGALGFQMTKNAPADGYTLVVGSNGPAVLLPLMNKSVGYNVLADFEPIGMAVIGGNIIVVNSNSAVHSLDDLRQAAKSKPDKLSYGSAGNGTTFHLGPALFDQINGSRMVHVPYKGGGPALLGLLGGEVDVVFSAMDAVAHVNAGKLRALAVLNKTRLAAAPTVPTTAELGMPELEMVSFYGLLAPKGTPQPIVERLSRELAVVVASAKVREQLGALLLEPAPDARSETFTNHIRKEVERWGKVIEANGIKAE
ncbi:Bug family tripartite tricarboxylate transporter substrate binding protein [Pseudorhodoferax sp.]|uniref:Bug family tripartite tricarboxylate transporter substrate binding protein n=1 Tax=Pseudorhodoferax sp. TaxID=1993553 RepID=UPI002DD6657D|nr:tripartite tricarboxylate transporter substrate binding protein [Pseudorhodoferax sp.]